MCHADLDPRALPDARSPRLPCASGACATREADASDDPLRDGAQTDALLGWLGLLAAPVAPPRSGRARLLVRVRAAAVQRAGEARFVPLAEPGVELALLHVADDGSTTALLRLQPSAVHPGEVCAGDEESLVLQGELTWGERVRRNLDYRFVAAGDARPTSCSTTGCLLLVRAACGKESA